MKTRKPTKRQMAVMIAEDVIAQIHAKKFIPTTGVYVASSKLSRGDLQQQVQKKTFRRCKVCALGSMFLSKANLFNDVSLSTGFVSREFDIVPALEEYFTYRELEDIESVFEDYSAAPDLDRVLEEFKHDRAQKLEYIMREVIRQKGRFNLAKAESHAGKILELRNKLEFNSEAFEEALTVLHS